MEAILQVQSVLRGKRTKRQRPFSPISFPIPNSIPDLALPSPTSVFTDTSCRTEEEEEEEDMAHCLILLAQGQLQEPKSELSASGTPRFGDFKVEGLFSYKCVSCDRSFSCFQALGGHRASHNVKLKPFSGTEQNRSSKQSPTTLQIPTRSKVHECAVCGVKFGSGQALGGHMRRHRTKTTTSGDVFNPEARKQMEFDLNMPPASENDRQDPNFTFPAMMSPMMDR